MADAAFRQDHPLSRAVAEPQVIEVSPAVVDVLIALGGAALFALAGVLLGYYLMLPFDIG